jgi:hypothetical protein
MREYLQTRDPAIFSTLVANANRSGQDARDAIIVELCNTDLPKLERDLLGRLGPGSINLVAWPSHNCGLGFQKLLQVYHQTVVDWEIFFGITYENFVGRDQGLLRAKPLMILYSNRCEAAQMGLAYRIAISNFPEYTVEISSQYPGRHEAMHGCYFCGRFPKTMGSDYCVLHDKHFRKKKTQRNPDEDIRKLHRQAQQGDYSDIILYLAAQARTGDLWAKHELRARTAFHALAELTRSTGLPEAYLNDLRVIAAENISRTAPPRFGYVLRDNGCFVILPTNRQDTLDNLSSIVRAFDGPGNTIKYFYWDGVMLDETTSQELAIRLEADLVDPGLQEWREDYFQPSSTATVRFGGPQIQIRPWSLHRVNFPMSQFVELRQELQRQEGYPLVGSTSPGYFPENTRPNPATLVKYLTAQEFLAEMNYQDETGKHRAIQPHWQRIADYAVKQSPDPNRPFVQVQNLPLNSLSLEHAPEERELIEEYAGRSTEFPPIYIGLTDYQLLQDPNARPKVKNGNHRVVAAKRRGDTVIDAIMTQETWRNLQKLESRPKRNPDERFRKAERQLRLDNTFENRVNFLRMRLRIGDISADRVEAAAEIGSPEAQAIYPPTGVVGIDWAISVLADYVPLKPIMIPVVLHSLEAFQDNEHATRYITRSFNHPRHDFSALPAIPTQGATVRFIEAAQAQIRDLLRFSVGPTEGTTPNWMLFDRIQPMIMAIRNVWFLSNQVVTGPLGFTAAERAFAIIEALGDSPEERKWQRQFIINCLLGNI